MPKEQRIIPPDEQLRAVRHVDPTGRIALGRKFAFRTFTLFGLPDGRILLAPVEFVEKHQMEAWRRAVRKGETPPPPKPLFRIPNELH